MTKLSTANLLSIHVLILRIFVFGGATRIVGAGSRQSQIGLSKGVLSANPLPGASGLGKLTTFSQSGIRLDGTVCSQLSFFIRCSCAVLVALANALNTRVLLRLWLFRQYIVFLGDLFLTFN